MRIHRLRARLTAGWLYARVYSRIPSLVYIYDNHDATKSENRLPCQVQVGDHDWEELRDARLHERATRIYEIHHALVWCSNSVRRFLRDRQSDVLKHPIVKHVLCALDNERGVCRPHAYECSFYTRNFRSYWARFAIGASSHSCRVCIIPTRALSVPWSASLKLCAAELWMKLRGTLTA